MESIRFLKHPRKRVFWILYILFCCSFIVFCGSYVYSVRQSSPSAMYQPVTFAGGETDSSNLQLESSNQGDIPDVPSIPGDLMPEEDEVSARSTSGSYPLQPVGGISASGDNASSSSLSEAELIVRNRGIKTNSTTSVIRIVDSDLPPELTCRSRALRPKLILVWTSFFGRWDYFPLPAFSKCEECSNCRSTTDRRLLLESDAVVFHARDMSVADLPAVRLPGQRWIFYCLESPSYSDFPGMEFMENMFNWTMTYRMDSDIVTTYGSFRKVQPPKKLDMASLRETWQWKTKSVVWMSSHCPTHGGRDNFVAQLKKYIDVDVYGECGNLECPRDSTDECMRKFASTYKFFLAFENSICRDYVTEKLYRTLKYDMIPVVFGGADYRGRAPPGSYVDALAFKSPKHLAYFLAGVGNDFSLYSNYFQWRKDYVLMDIGKECALCSMLHKHDASHPSTYVSMRKWWVADGKCRRWTPKG